MSLWALQPVRRYSVPKSVREFAKMARLSGSFTRKSTTLKEDSEKSFIVFIAYACFHNVKVGMKVAVGAFVEVSICFLKIHTYYIS